MVSLAQLWLPILLSAVFVFIASSIINMALHFWHGGNYRGFLNEDEVRAVVRKNISGIGMYTLPYCKPEDAKKPEMQAKINDGPVAFVFVRKNGMNMFPPLALWFTFCLIVSAFAGCFAGMIPAPNAKLVFHAAAGAALLGHAVGLMPMGIWWAHPWASVIKYMIDGVIYAAIVGGTFVWLWPA